MSDTTNVSKNGGSVNLKGTPINDNKQNPQNSNLNTNNTNLNPNSATSNNNIPVPNTNSNNNSTIPTTAPVNNPNPDPYWGGYNDPYMNPNFNMGYSYGNNYGATNNYSQNTNLTMEQKVEIIKNIFMEVLGREATDKDINYYKYGVVTEDSLRKKIVQTNEHKDLVKRGQDYANTKELLDDTESKYRLLESKLKDHLEEFQKIQIIFSQKNKYINDLREQLQRLQSPNSIYIDSNSTQQSQINTINNNQLSTKQKGFWDLLKKILGL